MRWRCRRRSVRFDAINVDTVMHHLISRRGYHQTINRIRGFLHSLHSLMRPSGVIVIREIYHEFRVRAALGSRTIFELTTLNVPTPIERTMRRAGLQDGERGGMLSDPRAVAAALR